MEIIPIALFAYKRPDHLEKTLLGLKNNQVPLIYAFSDGARTVEDEPLIDSVRHILHAVNWCDLRIIEQKNNCGLGNSIRSGVSEVLREYDKVIVVEDDIVFRPGAYQYAVAALNHYQNDPKIMSITMWSHPSLVPKSATGGFFSKRFVCWGWGTYADQWRKYNSSPLDLFHECEKRGLGVLKWGQDLKWQAENAEKRNLWYVGYALTHFLENSLSYLPTETLTVNIGFDGSGENCGKVSVDELMVSQPVSLPIEWPEVYVPKGLERRFAGYFEKKQSFLKRARKLITRILKRIPFFVRVWKWIKRN